MTPSSCYVVANSICLGGLGAPRNRLNVRNVQLVGDCVFANVRWQLLGHGRTQEVATPSQEREPD